MKSRTMPTTTKATATSSFLTLCSRHRFVLVALLAVLLVEVSSSSSPNRKLQATADWQYPQLGYDAQPSYLGPKDVILTFDDGPGWNANTLTLLNVLKQRNIKATFFVNSGQDAACDWNTANTRNAVQQMIQDGHEIGTHTRTHAHLPQLNDTEVTREIFGVETEIRQYIGGSVTVPRLTLFRAPYGEPYQWFWQGYNDPEYPRIAGIAAQGTVQVGWNIDPQDWMCPDNAADGGVCFYVNVTSALAKGSYGVILMHSTSARAAAGLPSVLDYLTNNGYTLRSVEYAVQQLYGLTSAGIVDKMTTGVTTTATTTTAATTTTTAAPTTTTTTRTTTMAPTTTTTAATTTEAPTTTERPTTTMAPTTTAAAPATTASVGTTAVAGQTGTNNSNNNVGTTAVGGATTAVQGGTTAVAGGGAATTQVAVVGGTTAAVGGGGATTAAAGGMGTTAAHSGTTVAGATTTTAPINGTVVGVGMTTTASSSCPVLTPPFAACGKSSTFSISTALPDTCRNVHITCIEPASGSTAPNPTDLATATSTTFSFEPSVQGKYHIRVMCTGSTPSFDLCSDFYASVPSSAIRVRFSATLPASGSPRDDFLKKFSRACANAAHISADQLCNLIIKDSLGNTGRRAAASDFSVEFAVLAASANSTSSSAANAVLAAAATPEFNHQMTSVLGSEYVAQGVQVDGQDEFKPPVDEANGAGLAVQGVMVASIIAVVGAVVMLT